MPSFKDIAVPTRNQTKKRGGEAAGEATFSYVPATSIGLAARTSVAAHRHRFAVGQRLSMAPGGREISRGASLCSVVFLLPYEGGALRYRVRSDNESFERIVNEADLMPLGDE